MQKFAGYELKDADSVRKAMSKKIAALMQAEGEKFITAAVKNGYSDAEARAVFDLIEPFAGYAFNKAHSACYGTIAYQTAYLKANYPHEYMTAVLSSAGAHERIAEAVAECVRLGIPVRPPDVNRSNITFELQHVEDESADARTDRSSDLSSQVAPQPDLASAPSSAPSKSAKSVKSVVPPGVPTIVFGLATVKNVGHSAAEGITLARAEGGDFTSIEDFTKRVDMKALNKRALESLIKCGALDALAASAGGAAIGRGTLLANLDRIVSLAQRELKLKETGQSTMFDMFGDSVATPLPSLELVDAEVSKAEMLSWERELLGVYVSEHPFTSAAVTISKHTSALVSEITAELDGREVVIAGMVNAIRPLTTKAGKTFVAVTIEDLSGSAEVTVWPDLYDPTKEIWQPGNILLMLVRVRERNERLQAGVQQVSLVQAADGTVSHEHFHIPAWLTEAVRTTAGVSITNVQRESNTAPQNGAPAPVGARRAMPSPGTGTDASNTAPASRGTTTDVSTSRTAAPLRDIEPTADPSPRTDRSSDLSPKATNGTTAAHPKPPATNGANNGNGATATPPRVLRFFLHESTNEDDDRTRLDALVALIANYPGADPIRLFIHAADGDRIELHLPNARACEELRTAGVELLGKQGGADPLPTQQATRGVEPLET